MQAHAVPPHPATLSSGSHVWSRFTLNLIYRPYVRPNQIPRTCIIVPQACNMLHIIHKYLIVVVGQIQRASSIWTYV